jgi:hypothetical protein
VLVILPKIRNTYLNQGAKAPQTWRQQMAINGTVVTSINSTTKGEYRAFLTDSLFGAKYQEKTAQSSHFLQCVFCGRDTSKQGNSFGVIVGEGGGVIVHPEDNELAQDGGFMGWFPVGSECIKSIPAEFRQANIYDNKVKGV